MTNHYQKKNTEVAAYQIRAAAAQKVVEQGSRSDATYEAGSEYKKLSFMYLGKIAYEDGDKEALILELRDQHFAWVDECFERAANFPQPTPESAAIVNSAAIAGDTAPTAPDDPDDPLGYLEETSGSGIYSGIAFENMNNVVLSLSSWQSAAGNAFKNTFLSQITCAAANQLIVMKTLRNVAAANQAVLSQASDDIFEIANNTISVIEADDSCCGSDADVNATLNVVAGAATVVAGVASIPLTLGVSSATVVGAATILAGALATYTASAGMSETNGTAKQLASDTVQGVLDNMKVAVETVYSSLDEANTSMAKVMNELYDTMISAPSEFIAPLSGTIRDATMADIVDEVESDVD